MTTICNEAWVTASQIAAVLASPPCETYSHADASDITRGSFYRQQDDPTKPPRKLKKGASKQARAKRDNAAKHDQMSKRPTIQLAEFFRKHGAEIIMKTPADSLDLKPASWFTMWISMEHLATWKSTW